MKLHLDYESRSEVNLDLVGAPKYAKHPSTEILCMAYKFNNEKSKIWRPLLGEPIPRDFKELYRDPKVIISAHNSLFEYCITEWVLRRSSNLPALPVERFHCTMAKAAAHAMPHALEKVTEALSLPLRKDMEGNRLVKKYMKPRPQWVKTGKGKKYFDDEFELMAIYDYCKMDCDVEKQLDDRLADLSPAEREVWLINQRMNLRGVQIDIDSVKKILTMIKTETKILNAEVEKITSGGVDSVLKVEALTDWLQHQGLEIGDLKKESVSEALADKNVKPHLKRVLEVRQQIAKASVKKYKRMIARADEDDKVRDLSKYHGASTGREAAQGIQVHNLPSRGLIKTTDFAIKLIKDEDFESLKLLYGNPFKVFSSCIRSVITASPGKLIHAGDYNAIECRILNWLAGNQEILDDFRLGRDLYKKSASRVLGIPIDKITDDQRQFGKVIELACGYQMGPPKFLLTCEDWHVKNISKELAVRAVKIYRETHQPVVEMWANMEKAAIQAVQTPGLIVLCHKLRWFMKGNFLFCELPSGRRLAYYGPTIRNEPAPWGEILPKLYYWRSKNKKWFETATYGGKLTENACQGIGRDIQVSGVINTTKFNFDFLFQVHDENISESEDDRKNEYEKLMMKLPLWATGLPVTAKAWVGERYRK